MSKKAKFALYLPPDLRAEVEEHYQEDGGHSLTAFIENAVRFYLGVTGIIALARGTQYDGDPRGRIS